MRKLNGHKASVYRAIVGAAALSLLGFIWMGIGMYRQRKTVEAEIEARSCRVRSGGGDKGAGGAGLFSKETITYNGKKYRRSSNVKAILCMGVDRAGKMTEPVTPGFGGQADGIFLIAHDTARNTLKILMIPRDTMADITLTDLSGNVLGKDMQHLTLAYAYGNGRESSCEYMADAVSGILGGFKIDWYLAADTSAIAMLNDEAGGVTVTIETEGMETRDPELVKGKTVTLKGKQAEIFVRFRDIHVDHSALFRMDQQQQYIRKFFETVQRQSSMDSGLVPRMFEQVRDYMVTNMAKDQYLKIALDAVGGGKLGDGDFYTVPGEGVATPGYDEFYADQQALEQVLLELFYREIEQ